jgi:hypothetical protein
MRVGWHLQHFGELPMNAQTMKATSLDGDVQRRSHRSSKEQDMMSLVKYLWLVLAFASCTASALELERPKVQIVDKFNVNVATGQVTHGFDTVSIGGAMGLSHRVSIYANEFSFLHNWGYADKFWSETRYVQLSTLPGAPIPSVFRLSGPTGSADFRVVVNGNPVPEFRNTPPPYSYVPIGDERHSLVSNNDELVWTNPDGTLVKFYRGPNATAGATGLMKEIVYPNGFTISIAVFGMQSVNTNTGFQLKYLYEADHRPMEKADKPHLMNAPPLATSSQSGWMSRNPQHIKGINNAVEYCAPAATTCSLTHAWPTATFGWPAGMPRTMFIGESQATIINAAGAVAKLDYRAYDLAFDEDAHLNPGGAPANTSYTADTWFSPRLIGVTPYGATSRSYEYDYKTLFNFHRAEVSFWVTRAQTAGVIKTARYIDKTIGYSMMQPYNYGSHRNYGIGGGVNHVVLTPQAVAGNTDYINSADTEDGIITFEVSARNVPISFQKITGPSESYEYTRGNLSRINRAGVPYQEAGFPASCTPTTQKICNQPEWIKDANGKITYYEYHAPSGQVSKITSPPDKRSIRPETRFEYTQQTARYFNGGSSKVEGSPIWMKTAERYCINSAYVNGACSWADEVVTRYEYHHDNLLLTGITITDPATGAVRRTCYQYDRYGNQIGVTQPKAGLASCE